MNKKTETNERGMFDWPISITMQMVIDVTDQPEELKDETRHFLEKLLSKDPAIRSEATQDLVNAVEMTLTKNGGCSAEADNALQNLTDIQAIVIRTE